MSGSPSQHSHPIAPHDLPNPVEAVEDGGEHHAQHTLVSWGLELSWVFGPLCIGSICHVCKSSLSASRLTTNKRSWLCQQLGCRPEHRNILALLRESNLFNVILTCFFLPSDADAEVPMPELLLPIDMPPGHNDVPSEEGAAMCPFAAIAAAIDASEAQRSSKSDS